MPLANYTIREAVQDDLEILQEFEQGVIQYERPFAPKLKEDPIVYYDIQNLIERDDAQVLVVVIDNKTSRFWLCFNQGICSLQKPQSFCLFGLYVCSPRASG